MFTAAPQNARRARPQIANITPLAIPAKGMNVRDALAVMGPEYAISLVNVIVEPYGIKTRKGYTEWAVGLPAPLTPIWTMMNYYPANAVPSAFSALTAFFATNSRRMLVTPRSLFGPPAGKLFAAMGGKLYDVTAGGPGPWVAQVGVAGATDFWSWINFQNIAGNFLLVCNHGGGYARYDGAAWTTVTMGGGAGQINGIDPNLFVFVMAHKRRLWFIEKNSSSAWYLPVLQIGGNVTEFDFGSQFRHGGHLAELANWTVDGGEGVDDYLIAVSSQGDVVVYKGTDPNDPTAWALHGIWYVGPLPVGRRALTNTGADIHILSHYGVTPLSLLLNGPKDLAAIEQRRTSYLISPLIARLMQDYSALSGWGISMLPKEELLVVKVPQGTGDTNSQTLMLKILTGAWSVMKDVPYTDYVQIDSVIYAGTRDGRVVRAFNGPLDNVTLAAPETGLVIQCQVTPSYQAMGNPGLQKLFKLVRPTFLSTMTPALQMQVLTDYGLPKQPIVPTLPSIASALWNVASWNVGVWSGVLEPIKRWLGIHGLGFVGTVQLDYRTGGDTMLTSIDFWTEQGGPL